MTENIFILFLRTQMMSNSQWEQMRQWTVWEMLFHSACRCQPEERETPPSRWTGSAVCTRHSMSTTGTPYQLTSNHHTQQQFISNATTRLATANRTHVSIQLSQPVSAHTHDTCLMATFLDNYGQPVPECLHSGFYWSQGRQLQS